MNEMIHEFSKGILNWYSFRKGSKILVIGNQDSPIADMLGEENLEVSVVTEDELCEGESDWEKDSIEKVDYIIAVGVLERSRIPIQILINCMKRLKGDGRLLLATENRLGLRYFCGDRDPFTEQNFDGIENYRRLDQKARKRLEGRCYAKFEIEEFLKEAGFAHCKFYAVMPDLAAPQLIYSEKFLPNEELSTRYFPSYHYPGTIFLEEKNLYTDLCHNKMFYQMANAYLAECSLDGSFEPVNHVTLSMERGKEYAMATVIYEDGKVEKCALYKKGSQRLRETVLHSKELRSRGITVVEGEIVEEGKYVMPYIEGSSAVSYLQTLFFQDREQFIREMDHFRECILKSSEPIEKEGDIHDGLTYVEKCYWDLVPLNAFVVNEEFVFYDQEFCEEDYPIELIVMRQIDLVYRKDMDAVLPREFFIKRYGLGHNVDKLRGMAEKLLRKLRNEKELALYHAQTRPNLNEMVENRQRINYTCHDYARLFVNLFDNIENKKLFIFGSGMYTRKFLLFYQTDYHIEGILDNNSAKWGTELQGICIWAPETIRQMPPDSYKVIICIKEFENVLKQVQELGATNIGIYNINMEYPRSRPIKKELASWQKEGTDNDSTAHKYHVGYVAGVFDLFHIGHLNLLRRAKEQCDHLIVGVATDEWVRDGKGTETFIPLQERMEVVKACRYADEVVEIPYNYADTRDAYMRFRFDVQFSGNDYVNNPEWAARREFLHQHGAELVFFPYTEGTSSTKLKQMIENRIL